MEKLSQEDVVKALGNLTVMQLIALTKELEQKWGVTAAPQVTQISTPNQDDLKQEVQTEFSAVLVSVPADKKMSVIKCIREVITLGLKESKDFVEAAPKVIREGISKEEAEAIKAKLGEAGGIVEIK